jgi:hypothetical protein
MINNIHKLFKIINTTRSKWKLFKEKGYEKIDFDIRLKLLKPKWLQRRSSMSLVEIP